MADSMHIDPKILEKLQKFKELFDKESSTSEKS